MKIVKGFFQGDLIGGGERKKGDCKKKKRSWVPVRKGLRMPRATPSCPKGRGSMGRGASYCGLVDIQPAGVGPLSNQKAKKSSLAKEASTCKQYARDNSRSRETMNRGFTTARHNPKTRPSKEKVKRGGRRGGLQAHNGAFWGRIEGNETQHRKKKSS